MLISSVDEVEGARGGGGEDILESVEASSVTYRSASELFDIMTMNKHFDENDNNSLTTQDLVLLYKNLDLGTHLMGEVTEVKRRRPNQRVETIVYDEPESDSDLSENLSKEDLHNIFNLNQDRMNILENISLDNILCHKFGNLQIHASDMTTEYSKRFLFRDSFLREQLQSLDAMASNCQIQSMLPTSLLDYVCCKTLKDNYNFYMDNIIKYVQITIDQLKRISNGEYLTDRTKEKWEEVNKMDIPTNYTKVLATSTSIPLPVECKKSVTVTWDDIVHSEIDVRSLCKILEKKIVIEIPKVICGSYNLFRQRYVDSWSAKCRGNNVKTEKESRLVLKLNRSLTRPDTCSVKSVVFFQPSQVCSREILPITQNPSQNCTKVTEIDPNPDKFIIIDCYGISDSKTKNELTYNGNVTELLNENSTEDSISNHETSEYPFSDSECCETTSNMCLVETNPTSINMPEVYDEKNDTLSPDELRETMRKLSIHMTVLEESSDEASGPSTIKKKSPVRVRIKSPYENKSHILEEKKRNRLIEIREKREKKKIALSEKAKVSKHKYGKTGIVPQASVTKLSITNKSFYNSIYGQKVDENNHKPKTRSKSNSIEKMEDEAYVNTDLRSESDLKKFIDRSYYLDDTETEIMYMQKQEENNNDQEVANRLVDLSLVSTTMASHESKNNFTRLSPLADIDAETDFKENETAYNHIYNNSHDAACSNGVYTNSSAALLNNTSENECKELADSLECRKSIDKLYNLMKKLDNYTDASLLKDRNNVKISKTDLKPDAHITVSESGTSLKHYVTSSNPSNYSLEKSNIESHRSKPDWKKDRASPGIPKVIISSKLEKETEKLKKSRKKIISPPLHRMIPENPLKAISQLLLEFDSVQKTRQKPAPESKINKKPHDSNIDGRPIMIRSTMVKRRSRFEQYILKESAPDKKILSKDKKIKPSSPVDPKNLQQQINVDDKFIKKMMENTDEAKEARGEAVRGPSRPNSRLMSLAQPKRTYVKAHSEEYQTKYGKNLMADRLQRLAGTLVRPPTDPLHRSGPYAFKNRMRRDTTSSVSMKQPSTPMQPIDFGRMRRSSSNSPHTKSVSPNISRKVPDSPESLKKVMEKKSESYVKSHYGRYRHTDPAQLRDEVMHKQRVPLLTKETDTCKSPRVILEESHELGQELHLIIDAMCSPALGTLSEANENTIYSKVPEKTNTISNNTSTDSHYNFDLLDDKALETAVESEIKGEENNTTYDSDAAEISQDDLKLSLSATELKKLENALYTQLSGTFQKRLRIKNLTLTPKPSLNQVILLQSGDTKSLILKSTVSNDSDLKAVSLLKSHLSWDFTHIPLQIATIGYSFPIPELQTRSQYELQTMRRLVPSLSTSNESSYGSEQKCQSLKEYHESNKELLSEAKIEDKISITYSDHDSMKSEMSASKMDLRASYNTKESSSNMNIEKLTTINESERNTTSDQSVFSETSCTNNTGLSTDALTSSQSSVDYTTSLDILVGLLNEIQNITRPNPPVDQYRELENILTSSAIAEDKYRGMISMSSLEKMNSNSGVCVYPYGNAMSDFELKHTQLLDKEVSVNLSEKELKSTLTEVPSLFPLLANHSTSVSNSLIRVIAKPSSKSIVSFDDYNTVYSNMLFRSHSPNTSVEELLDIKKDGKDIKRADLNAKTYLIAQETNKRRIKLNKRVIPNVKTCCPVMGADFDPTIKMKRDILVTVYSILVFTVFAALSLPDMALFGV